MEILCKIYWKILNFRFSTRTTNPIVHTKSALYPYLSKSKTLIKTKYKTMVKINLQLTHIWSAVNHRYSLVLLPATNHTPYLKPQTLPTTLMHPHPYPHPTFYKYDCLYISFHCFSFFHVWSVQWKMIAKFWILLEGSIELGNGSWLNKGQLFG